MKLRFIIAWCLFGCQLAFSACSDDDGPLEVVFRLQKTVPAALRDTIFVDNTVNYLTVEIESNVSYKSVHPQWLKKAESPVIGNNPLIVKYVVEKFKENGRRDGVITLSAADGSKSFSLQVCQTNVVEDTRELLFEDDFEGDAFDDTKWGYEPKDVSAWNYYVVQDAEHVQVKDGNLWVRATWDAATSTPKTGAVSTHGKFSFTYGEIQVRAKFVRAGQGGWPAIWMMPETALISGWPDCGELDIMERLNNETKYYSTVHMNNTYRPNPYTITPTMDPSGYNVYGMKKSPNKIEFYLNGEKTLTMEKPADANEIVKWPFETDFYLILNQACADQGKSGMSFWPGLVTDPSALPYEMAVDWVKVYKLEE